MYCCRSIHPLTPRSAFFPDTHIVLAIIKTLAIGHVMIIMFVTTIRVFVHRRTFLATVTVAYSPWWVITIGLCTTTYDFLGLFFGLP